MRIVELLVVVMVAVLAFSIAGDVYMNVIRLEKQAEAYAGIESMSGWVLPAISVVTNCTEPGEVRKGKVKGIPGIRRAYDIRVRTCVYTPYIEAGSGGMYRVPMVFDDVRSALWYWWAYAKRTGKAVRVWDEYGCTGEVDFSGSTFDEDAFYVRAGCAIRPIKLRIEGQAHIVFGQMKDGRFILITAVLNEGGRVESIVEELSSTVEGLRAVTPVLSIWSKGYIEADFDFSDRSMDTRIVAGKNMDTNGDLILDIRDGAPGSGHAGTFPLMFYRKLSFLFSMKTPHRTEQYCARSDMRGRAECLLVDIGVEVEE